MTSIHMITAILRAAQKFDDLSCEVVYEIACENAAKILCLLN